jgi:hypothetical protein
MFGVRNETDSAAINETARPSSLDPIQASSCPAEEQLEQVAFRLPYNLPR